MQFTSHEPHVSMHAKQIERSFGGDRQQALLRRAGLRFEAGRLCGANGQLLGPVECMTYLAAVKALFDEQTYAFARINFGFARCTCVAGDDDPPQR